MAHYPIGPTRFESSLGGGHDYCIVFPGTPLGFTVGRGMNGLERRKVEGWARDFRTYLEHELGEDFQLTASVDNPVFFCTRAWYANRVHCDPENTHKLAKDVCFRSPIDSGLPGTSDKYTGGLYDWPRYDSMNPRLEVWIWNL